MVNIFIPYLAAHYRNFIMNNIYEIDFRKHSIEIDGERQERSYKEVVDQLDSDILQAIVAFNNKPSNILDLPARKK